MRLRHLREQGGAHRGRCDAVYADRSIGQFLPERFRERNHRSLACAIGGRIRIAALARNRGDVDDAAVISLAHQRHDRPAAIECAFDIHREDFSPVLDRILPQLGVGSADSMMSMSIAGAIPSVFCTATPMDVGSLTSAPMLDAPSFLPAACAASPLRSQITTLAPDATRRSAIANPNPDAPPVTRALRPLKSS